MTDTPKHWGKGWPTTRVRILERDGRVCQMRLPGCTGVATTVDHVVPRRLGGGHEDANLRAACAHCNYGGGGRLRGALARAKRPVMPRARRSRWG